jgi:hypothetical protein
MIRRVLREIAIRFFGCVGCGLVLSIGYYAIWIFFHPYEPEDSWTDVGHEMIPGGIIGVLAGSIIGALWCLAWGAKQLADHGAPRAK